MKNRRHMVFSLIVILLITACTKKITAETPSPLPQPAAENALVTFIELGSVKCVPCQAMVPVMEQMERELSGQVEVVFHDVWTDEGEPFAKQYKIRVIPTQIFLDSQGEEYFRHEGFFPIEEIYPILAQAGITLP